MRIYILGTILALICTPALADVSIQFDSERGTDSFTITNMDACPLEKETIKIDLELSLGGLIFDTVQGGPGLNRATEFSVMRGEHYLALTPVVRDGDNQLTLDVDKLPGDATIILSLDTDFLKGGSGAEVFTPLIEGGRVKISNGDAHAFDHTGYVLVPGGGCVA